MKLGLRLLLSVAGVLCILVVLFAALDQHRLRTLLEKDLRRDALHLSRALATSLEDVHRHGGDEGVRRRLEDVDLHDDAVEVRWVVLEELTRSGFGQDFQGVSFVRVGRSANREAEEVAIGLAPLRVAGELRGAIQVSESLGRSEAYLAGSRQSYAATALALWATALAAAFLLGRRWIVEPVLRIQEHMKLFGAGKIVEPLLVDGDDELSELAEGLNEMCAALRSEEERGRAISNQLQHAERLLTVGKLAAGLAHEIGSPLHVISGRARRIMRRHEGDDDSERDAQIIRDQAERISEVTRKLLDFARRDTPARVSVDPSSIAASVVAILEPEAVRRGSRLELEEGSFEEKVELDPRQVEQVLVNLIMNGVDATGDGGVVRVEVRPERDDAGVLGVEFVIEDDGEGIDPADRSHVFDPFFTTKAVGEGTGLGLSVVHGIVQDHGGRVRLESELGGGTTVRVHLPGRTP